MNVLGYRYVLNQLRAEFFLFQNDALALLYVFHDQLYQKPQRDLMQLRL